MTRTEDEAVDRARLQVVPESGAPRYLTVAEAARASGSSRRAVYRAAIDRGELAANIVCPRLRIHPDALGWMEGSRTAATAPPHSGDRIGVRKPQAADGLRSLLDKASSAA
jgi:hypothetical protein